MNTLSLLLAIKLSLNHGGTPRPPRATSPVVHCAINTVAYRFTGEPGQRFEYGGDSYAIPAAGSIELIADGSTTYRQHGILKPLNVWPADEFSTREVKLSKP